MLYIKRVIFALVLSQIVVIRKICNKRTLWLSCFWISSIFLCNLLNAWWDLRMICHEKFWVLSTMLNLSQNWIHKAKFSLLGCEVFDFMRFFIKIRGPGEFRRALLIFPVLAVEWHDGITMVYSVNKFSAGQLFWYW